MSATCVWTGGLRRLNVTVIRREGDDLPPGYWEARTCESATKVLVRPEDLEPVLTVGTGGAA